ncbi:hypothetical protein [Pengzhenrongella sp.]|jgi:hypothetical protein|uniref:hypothetical protein n=1 Tax=Pengzhenrongella sp. TaxID=2888820 RepID=UPI002F956893
MTSPLRRRTTTAALAALCVGALLTATAPATWAAPAGTAGDSTSTSSSPATPAPTTPAPDPADGGPTVVVKDGKVTLTLDADRVTALCERVPAERARIGHLLDRIQGGADVKGSAAWLSHRADQARAAGRDAKADRLKARAERRTGRVGQLTKADDRLARAQRDVCAPLAEQLAGTA